MVNRKHTLFTDIPLTLVLVKEAKGGFTSYFQELSDIMSSGDTEEEAFNNLIATVKTVFAHLKKENEDSPFAKGASVKKEDFRMELEIA